MKLAATIILMFLFKLAGGQPLDVICNNEKIQGSMGGSGINELMINCPCVAYSDTNLVPAQIREINRQYLLNRVGGEFYKRLILRNIFVVERNSPSLPNVYNNPAVKKLCNKNVKYAFEYYFEVQSGLKHSFSTVYDENGVGFHRTTFLILGRIVHTLTL